MTKRLIDLDDEAEALARQALGTKTYRATVNEALRLAATRVTASDSEIEKALDRLAELSISDEDRDQAWSQS